MSCRAGFGPARQTVRPGAQPWNERSARVRQLRQRRRVVAHAVLATVCSRHRDGDGFPLRSAERRMLEHDRLLELEVRGERPGVQ